jgi:ABC-type multidrug transport system fused ATPase/permease subunit
MHLPLRDYGSLLARYLRAQRAKVFLLALLLLGSIGLQLVNPQLVRSFIDAAQAGSPLATLLQLALLFLGAAFLNYLLTLALTYLSEDVGWRTTNALRTDLAAHCLRLDMRFHQHYTPGALIERVDGDVGQLARFFAQLFLRLVSNLILLVGVLAVLAWEDWRLAAGFLAFLGGAFWILFRLRNFATPYLEAERAASADLFGFLEERLGGRDDLRANGAIPYTIQRLFLVMRAYWRAGMAARVRGAIFGSIIVDWNEVGTALVLALGAFLFLHDTLSIGVLYLLYAYIRQLTGPLLDLTGELQQLQEASASINRIKALLDERSTITEGAVSTLPGGPLAVAFKGVHFAYDQPATEQNADHKPLLADFTLALPAGRTLGVLGRTGSGKTTLTRLLLRFYDPQAGGITLGDVDLRQLTLPTLRRHVGIVTQEVQLFNASVRDNLTFFDRRIADDALWDALSTVGLQEWVAKLPAGLDTVLSGAGALSAGEAQLLAFARLLLRDPSVVILDEASSRLDPVTEGRLDQAISALLKNRTAIIIAHRLRTVQKVDDILILEQGRIQEVGPRAHLAADPASRFSQLLQTGLDFDEVTA